MTNKRPSKMTFTEATAALARERAYKARGLSYSGRRIGALLKRLAALGPGTFPVHFRMP